MSSSTSMELVRFSVEFCKISELCALVAIVVALGLTMPDEFVTSRTHVCTKLIESQAEELVSSPMLLPKTRRSGARLNSGWQNSALEASLAGTKPVSLVDFRSVHY